MKIVTIVGARPQFVKAAALGRRLRKVHQEILVHTGQHYDDMMSDVFFRELDIPRPDINLNVGSGGHGAQTGEMLAGIEKVLVRERPDLVLVYGDTNSTIAGALAAVKLGCRVAHVEAGLRSFNRAMPEEINRVLTDHISDLLFCPSETARENLKKEGVVKGVFMVGDIMADALKYACSLVGSGEAVLRSLGLYDRGYLLATIHRAENTDNPQRLKSISQALNELDETVVFPVHPRTRQALSRQGIVLSDRVVTMDPVGYLHMVTLQKNARMVLTDSGGVQKEAYWLGVPCITLRDETEWVETVETGWNVLAGADRERIVAAVKNFRKPGQRPPLYGDGAASEKIAALLATDG